MKFHAWKMIVGGWNKPNENHVFLEDFGHPDYFKSLCGKRFGALCSLDKKGHYCTVCKELAPVEEEKSQNKEKERIDKLELKRPSTIEEINDIVNTMSIDDMLDFLFELKRARKFRSG